MAPRLKIFDLVHTATVPSFMLLYHKIHNQCTNLRNYNIYIHSHQVDSMQFHLATVNFLTFFPNLRTGSNTLIHIKYHPKDYLPKIRSLFCPTLEIAFLGFLFPNFSGEEPHTPTNRQRNPGSHKGHLSSPCWWPAVVPFPKPVVYEDLYS